MILKLEDKLMKRIAIVGALSEPVRLRAILLLAGWKGIKVPVKTVAQALGVRHSVASHHLIILLNSGLVECESIGNSRLYELRYEWLEELDEFMKELKVHFSEGVTNETR